MSTTVIKNRAFYEAEDLKQKLSSMDECEHDLQLQQAGLRAYNELFTQYRLRFSFVQNNESLSSEELKQMERMWKRLSTNSSDPAELVEERFLQKTKKLRKESAELWKSISESIEERGRILESWYEHIEEVSYRLYLLSEFGKRLESCEAQIEDVTNQSWTSKAENSLDLQPTDSLFLDEYEKSKSQESLSVSASHSLMIKPNWKARPNRHVEQKTHEQREFERIDLGTTVSFGTSEHSFYTGFTENISSGGLFVATYDLMPSIGERFTISFTLPNEYQINALCRVSWLREYMDAAPEVSPGFGCQLLKLSEEEQTIINQCIASSGSMFMPPF